MLNDLTIRKAVELELKELENAREKDQQKKSDMMNGEHTPADEAAFVHALHKHTPFEAVEAKIAEELKQHDKP